MWALVEAALNPNPAGRGSCVSGLNPAEAAARASVPEVSGGVPLGLTAAPEGAGFGTPFGSSVNVPAGKAESVFRCVMRSSMV